MPIDLDDPEDRRVATWLAAQSSPAAAVKKLILATAAGKAPADRLVDLLPTILQEVRALRAEVRQSQHQTDPVYEALFVELRALRADLARSEQGGRGVVEPPPEDPEAAQRLDTLFR
jgi:hypothetical protein